MPPEPPPDTSQTANKIANLLRADYFGTGPRAALRRMNPKNLGEPALQRVLADYIPDHWLGDHGMADWALIIHAIALGSPDNLLGAKPLGAALAQAQYSESRLARLLQADRPQLNDLLPRACRFLVAKGEALSPAGLAHFVIDISNASRADTARMKIARDFYRASRPAATTPTQD